METEGITLSPQDVAMIQELLKNQSNIPNIDPKTLTIFLIVILVLTLWSLVWKGLALWRSAKNGHKWWFFFILILNTLGVLEIVYLLIYRKRNIKIKMSNEREVKIETQRPEEKDI